MTDRKAALIARRFRERVRICWACGRFTGIPACCVVWFIALEPFGVYDGSPTMARLPQWFASVVIWLTRAPLGTGVWYVRCPLCRLLWITVPNHRLKRCCDGCPVHQRSGA